MQLSDQWVLITGGARGLGQAIVRALSREGAGVVINYHRSDAAAQALADELGPRAIALQADVTDAAAVHTAHRHADEGCDGCHTDTQPLTVAMWRLHPRVAVIGVLCPDCLTPNPDKENH